MKLKGRILTTLGWFDGQIEFGTTVENISPRLEVKPLYIVPGFIDVHVHGGGGGDAMDGTEGLAAMSRFHARHGTTALLATTITNPWDNVLGALEAIRNFTSPEDGAQVVGAHLEGPFISPHRLGAQPPFTVDPTPERVRAVLATGVVRVVTVAPELPGALEAIGMFLAADVRVSLGHTVADAETVLEVFALATRLKKSHLISGTHLYNAMGGLEGRKPGVLGALLGNPNSHGEVILDGHHVHPSAFRAAFFAKPERLMLITDAIRAAGQPDGTYDLGGQAVQLEGGVVRLPDGTLAGSVLTMIQAVRNAVAAGLAPEVALKLATLHPAQYLGLAGYGKLMQGSRADLLVLDEALEVQAVYIGGRQVHP
jgi:N-acetylglucosamine-6-phosphate deacetylase